MPDRLLLRLAGFGLVLLILPYVVVLTAAKWVLEPTFLARARSVATRYADHLPPIDQPEKLALELRRLDEMHEVHASVYSNEGRLVATSQLPPLVVTPDGLAGLAHERAVSIVQNDTTLVALYRQDSVVGHIVMTRPPPPRSWRALVMFVASLLVAVAIMAIPLARSIAKPLEQLADAARRLGKGDLEARAVVRGSVETRAVAQAFNDMATQLAMKRRAERELLANVSHELLTPLSRIRVVLEIAADDDPLRGKVHLTEIAADLAELEKLVDDVLETARLDVAAESGGLPILREVEVYVHEFVARVAARFAARYPDRDLHVSTTAVERLSARLDERLVGRAVDNLLDNAQKYSSAPSPIELIVSREAGSLRFEVTDEGVGLPALDPEELFRPFERGDASRTRATGGVGLGLALTRRILSAHHGTVTLRRRPGCGTSALCALPLGA